LTSYVSSPYFIRSQLCRPIMAKTGSPTENAFGRQSPIRDAFIKRSAHVIERLAERADEATLAEAMSAPTDFGTLARVLTDVGVIGTAVAELDPEALDLAREIEHRDKLVQRAGGMLSAEEAGLFCTSGVRPSTNAVGTKRCLLFAKPGTGSIPERSSMSTR